jgi:acyl transferase domain-containing protein/thioesterase domain-containing protein/acyl carrier protein
MSTPNDSAPERTGSEIAIVGIAVHLPGAPDVATYWRNLAQGVESIRRLSREELVAAGVDEATLDHPDYVPVAAPLAGVADFDPEFFGMSPKEAAIMDPQHRHFLEACWEALEDAGHVPSRFGGPIGVFAGCGMGAYFAFNLLGNRKLVDDVGLFLLRHTGNDKDFLATRASYVFDLKGPSVNVQTACSTSLVAVHQAAQSLLSGECDMALAGGVTIELPHGQGYLFKEGEILSPDGHVHAFDHRATGTVFGSGTAVVVLRRLEDALADGDHVYAVVKGSAVNNDGRGKAGYLAPSIDGQAAAIAEALAVAGVGGDEIDYVECHGTGTAIGDPIEVAALTQAFRETTDVVGAVALGSVKTNIGHTDTAAGTAALAKVALALDREFLPASLGYEAPNPTIDFQRTPFFVNATGRDWKRGARVRRAGVTSLGVGGTNAHLVVEEAPLQAPAPCSTRPFETLVLSARSAAALDAGAERLAAAFASDARFDFADAAYTLAVGRAAFEHRRVLVAKDCAEAAALLSSKDKSRVFTHRAGERQASVCFLFPGGGAQHIDMGRDLFRAGGVFAQWMQRGFAWLAQRGLELERVLYAAEGADRAALARELERPSVQLPALFLVEFALAKEWEARGVTPALLVGHSMGENTAAALAGVMRFEDALGLVRLRGVLFEKVEKGGMLSIAAPQSAVAPLLGADCDLACVNAAQLCVASGPQAALAALAERLAGAGLEHARIPIDIAAHSRLLDPILPEFRAYLASIQLSAPKIPIVSNVTGARLSDADATSPDYWVRHLRSTVHFAACVAEVAKQEHVVLLEVGPGKTLASLARGGLSEAKHQHAFHSLRHADEQVADDVALATAHARLWAAGAIADAATFFAGETRRRVSLPTYAFQRRRFWIDADVRADAEPALARLADAEQFFARVVWHPAPLVAQRRSMVGEHVLVFADTAGVATRLAGQLTERGAVVTLVTSGDTYVRVSSDHYRLATERGREGFALLLEDLVREGRRPSAIVHLMSLSVDRSHRPGSSFFHETLERGFHALFFLGQALSAAELGAPVRLLVAANGLQALPGERIDEPAKALALGALRTLPREVDGLSASALDVVLPPAPKGRGARRRAFEAALDAAAVAIARELDAGGPAAGTSREFALRGSDRFVRTIVQGSEAAPARGSAFTPRRHGAYLVTGGLGGVGLALARHLAHTVHARLVLLGRRALPPRDQWDAWLVHHGSQDTTSQRIGAVRELEALGGEVLVVPADVTDPEALRTGLVAAKERFGTLDGVFHAAGVVDDGLLATRTFEQVEAVLAPKVHGTLVLDAALREVFGAEQPRFLLTFSSTSAAIGAAGQIDYAAANAFLDAFAARSGACGSAPRAFETALAWGLWRDVGIAARAGRGERDDGARKALSRHPLFDTRIEHADGRAVLTGRWRTRDLWLLDEHRTAAGEALLPGTGSFELFGAALRELGTLSAFAVEDLTFFRPLYVPDDSDVVVRVVLEPHAAGHRAEVHSRRRPDEPWQRHTSATLVLRRPTPREPVAVHGRLAGATHTARAGAEGSLTTAQEAHLAFGPHWRVLRETWRDGDACIARLELPVGTGDDLSTWPLHAGLLDIATGFAMELVPQYDPARGLWVPVRYERVVIHAPLEREVFAFARAASGPGVSGGTGVSGGDDFFTFDVDVVAADGRVLVEVRGFAIHRPAQLFRPSALPAPRESELVRGESGGREARAARDEEFARRVRLGLTADEGFAALERVLGAGDAAHTFVSSLDVNQLVLEAGRRGSREATDDGARFERPDLDSDYVAPRDQIESQLVEFFQELLGVARVGVNDDFFALGGHSLVAVRLFARIEKTFGLRQPMSVLFEAPTPAAVAALVRAHAPAANETSPAATAAAQVRRHIHLVPMNGALTGRAGARTPFFLAAGMFGNVLNLRHLAHLVGSDRPFHGLQARGLFGDLAPHETFEEAARDQLAELREVQPHGPYLLGGFSGGGLVAYEMAQQLVAAGELVAALILLDTPLPGRDPIDAIDKLHMHLQRINREGPSFFANWLRSRIAWEQERRRKAAGPAAADTGHFHDEAIEAAFRRALTRYDTQPYAGPVHLFRPALPVVYRLRGNRLANQWREVIHADNGWSRYVRDLTVREVPGDHDAMVLEPNVRVLAAHIRRVLDAADEGAQRAFGPSEQRRAA